jgi:hypothetical protein
MRMFAGAVCLSIVAVPGVFSAALQPAHAAPAPTAPAPTAPAHTAPAPAAPGVDPAALSPAIMLSGRGVQIYTCAASGTGAAWHLKAPDADLLDARGHSAGHHGAGPVWRANDGSSVTGEKLAESAAPAAGAIPWLVLRAKAHAGTGLFSSVAFIVRSQTEGGAAPKTGCDTGHLNAEIRVRYNATYLFFPA